AASEGRVLVVLDGLDEVARVTDRGDIVRETIRLHDRLQAANAGGRYSSGQLNRLVLTSRFSGYRTSPVLHPAVENFGLCSLIPRQVTRLHKALFDTLAAAGADDRDALRRRRLALRREIASGPHGSGDWIDTPLMAILVAVIFLSDGRLPKTKEALYRRVLD